MRPLLTRLRASIAAMAVIAGLGLTPMVALPAAAAPAPVSGISFSSATSGSAVSSPTAEPDVDHYEGDNLYMHLSSADGSHYDWFLYTSAATTLTEGATMPVSSNVVDGALTISVYANTRSMCPVDAGTAVVRQLVRGVDDDVSSLAIDVQGTCGTEPVRAQLRINSTVPYSGLDRTGLEIGMGRVWVEERATRSFQWTARGTEPVVAGTARLTDPTRGFAITQDECAGRTLSPGQSCVVTVQGAPRVPGDVKTDVYLDTGAGQAAYGGVTVSMTGERGAKGSYHALRTVRILDTRSGLGAVKRAVGPGQSLRLQVLGRGGVPASYVSAVSLNLTLVGTTASTYVTAYPSGTARPTTSSINAPQGFTGANTITVSPGADGTITLYNASGSTHMLADVSGFYSSANVRGAGQDFQLVRSERIVDTRSGGGPLKADYWLDVPLDYGADLGTIQAFALNVTVTGATKPGFLTVWSGVEDPSLFSTLNFTPGTTRTNTVIVRSNYAYREGSGFSNGFGVYNGATSGSAHVIVDVAGVFTSGGGDLPLRFKPADRPTRILDSRYNLGASTWTAGSTRTVVSPVSVAGDDTLALVGNLTLVRPSAYTYLTFWRAGVARPPTSNINAAAGQTVANGAVIPVGSNNDFSGWNAGGTANVIYDVTGSFELYPASPESLDGAATPARRSAAPATGRETALTQRLVSTDALSTPKASPWR